MLLKIRMLLSVSLNHTITPRYIGRNISCPYSSKFQRRQEKIQRGIISSQQQAVVTRWRKAQQ